ncbi:MAG: metal-sulfur cluster assembly factor [Magnetospirillum sp.]|nr:metal-sulfur cluster assembly factor [Magnetospirillum sp.]
MITEAQALDALKGVIDPDIGINIVDLGMVERVAAGPEGVAVALIMTTPACPQSGYLQDECARVLAEAGVNASVEVLDMPLWEPERLSESAKQTLGW